MQIVIVCISDCDLFIISHQSDNLDTPCGNITLHLGGILTSEMLTEVMLHNVTHGHSSHVITVNPTLVWRQSKICFSFYTEMEKEFYITSV